MTQGSDARGNEISPAVEHGQSSEPASDERQNMDREPEAEESRIRRVYAKRKQLIPEDRYSSRNPGNVLIRLELERHLLDTLERIHCRGLGSQRILDIGCGSGYWLQRLARWGAEPRNLFGVDLRESGIEEARRGGLRDANLAVGNATKLNFDDETFDLVLQFVVFSSVLDWQTKRQMASEMTRVVKPNGHIIWYDFFVNNPWNPDVRGVGKKEIGSLFPGSRRHLKRLTVAPPFTRRMGRLAPFLYPALAKIKICSTHYLGFFEK